MTKICNKCNFEKELSNFYKHALTKDGYFGHCKKCHREYNKIMWAKNPHKIPEAEIPESKICPKCNIEKKTSY